jgi:hypothetical protein
MVAHPALVERRVSREQVALVDGAAVRREGRADHREIRAERIEERVRHGPDIALGRRVEGGAVLEVDLPDAFLAKVAQGGKRVADGVLDRAGPRLERDHDRFRSLGQRPLRQPDHLHGSQAGLDEHAREVARSREIVRNAADEEAHVPVASCCALSITPLQISPIETAGTSAMSTRPPIEAAM